MSHNQKQYPRRRLIPMTEEMDDQLRAKAQSGVPAAVYVRNAVQLAMDVDHTVSTTDTQKEESP